MASKQIFISYSHKDKEWLERLQVNLKPFMRESSVQAWDDTRIKAGSDWREEINQALASASIAILLVSSDFLASDFIYNEELPFLVQAAKEKNVRIIPVAVRPSAWSKTSFGAIQCANNPDKPLSALDKTDREKEFVRICELVTSDFAGPACTPVQTSVVTASVAAIPAASPITPAAVAIIEPATQSAEQGLLALVELMRNPEVQAKVATFDAVFETSSTQIETLGYYKDLHDLLHTLQFNCCNYLTNNIVRRAKRDPDDETIWDDVDGYEQTLQNIMGGLDKAAQQDSNARTALPWIQKLIDNLKILFQCLEQKDIQQIDCAIKPIQRVLAVRPSQINACLAAAAEALPLARLVEDLTKVRDSLDGARVSAVTMSRFVEGVQAIEQLKEKLNALIESHNKWQEIDLEIRRIEGNMAADYTELEDSWADLRVLTQSQCDCSEEDWAQLLKKKIAELDKALAESDAVKIRQSFQSYRSKSNARFFEVDLDLKELCAQLRKVGEPLTTILEMMR
ncbi:MAG TPA: toll/interleukin-1 receptor domain-containing protein [Pyrinomonadaceae bacterium]|nr:toll/interleukin-1 receptor domain-containing protein [Pyrinomonadaceae bacterium]